jgi:hypothetical protein
LWPNYTERTDFDSAFRTYSVFTTVPPVLSVEIDVKPGNDDNVVNLGSNGVIPVAILSSEDFDATTVDPCSVELTGDTEIPGAGVALRGKKEKPQVHNEDVNDDGLLDLVCHIETENLDPLNIQEGVVYLKGNTFEGQAIQGSDVITVVPPTE